MSLKVTAVTFQALWLFIFVLICFSPHLQAQMRKDSTYYSTTHMDDSDVSAQEFGLGAPPVRLGDKVMWINSLGGQQWYLNSVHNLPELSPQDAQIRYSSYRYTAVFLLPQSHLNFVVSSSFNSLELNPQLNRDANFNSYFMSYSDALADNPNFKWTVGLVALDRSNKNRVFPLAGFSYSEADSRWRFTLGFPAMGASYSPNDAVELTLLLAKESSKYLIDQNHSLAPEGRYLEQELTLIGIGGTLRLNHGFKFNLRIATLLQARYRFLDSNFDEVSTFKNDYGKGLVSAGFSWGFR